MIDPGLTNPPPARKTAAGATAEATMNIFEWLGFGSKSPAPFVGAIGQGAASTAMKYPDTIQAMADKPAPDRSPKPAGTEVKLPPSTEKPGSAPLPRR